VEQALEVGALAAVLVHDPALRLGHRRDGVLVDSSAWASSMTAR
jgi:hypothetical protein